MSKKGEDAGDIAIPCDNKLCLGQICFAVTTFAFL